MALFNGGRMIALFLCVLFALNTSFAQDEPKYETYILYMVDPVDEQLAPAVYDYIDKWNDPLTWETFEDDFTPARQAQIAQIRADNELRKQKAYEILRNKEECDDGTCLGNWVPRWIPLKRAGDSAQDSLFKNILSLPGSGGQLLEEFLSTSYNVREPDRESESGIRDCLLGASCAQAKRLVSFFEVLLEAHKLGNDRIISLTFEATPTLLIEEDPGMSIKDPSFVEELESGRTEKDGGTVPPTVTVTEDIVVKEGSVRLLQPAMHDPNPRVIDSPDYWQPAAKPIVSETSSWGRIKAILAD